jgi:hypothetical protein
VSERGSGQSPERVAQLETVFGDGRKTIFRKMLKIAFFCG